jgi:LCP family protein required for cell wall assembly
MPDDNEPSKWSTRTPRPAPAAAPWERGKFQPDNEVDAAEAGSGNHTAGIPVADLFARLTGEIPAILLQGDTEAEPRKPAHGWPEDVDPPTVPVPSAYADDFPDLTSPVEPQADASTAVRLRSPDAGPGAGKRHPRAMLAGRAVAAIMAVLALVLTGGAWQWTAAKNSRLNYVAALDPTSRDIVDPNAQFGDENFLIVGADSRIGENGEMGAGGTDDAEGARSDTVILVNIPASRKRVVAVSFPRDTAITPMKCDAWDARNGRYGPVWDDETETYGPARVYTETKLNSAYSFGGPKCLVKVVQKITGLSINRFIAIDFAGFAKMVDALGGVEVCSTTSLEDYELGTVLPTAGRQLIDGHTALNYVRARQITTEHNGDYGRIKRQQMFLSSLLRSLISKDTFFSLNKLNNVVNMFISDSHVDNIQTKDLVELGQSIQGVSAGRVTFVTLPTTGVTDEEGNEVPDDSAIRTLFDAIIDDDPLPGENDNNETTTPVASASEKPTTTSSSKTSETSGGLSQLTAPTTEVVRALTAGPEDVSVHVSNSTETIGLGSAVSTALQTHGFNVDAPDDYSKSLSRTTVMYSPGNEQAAATVSAALGHPRIERVTGLGRVVRVVLASDFNGVHTPLPSGSAISVKVTHDATTTSTRLPEDLTLTNGADTTCE